jgi:hypothetical protein
MDIRRPRARICLQAIRSDLNGSAQFLARLSGHKGEREENIRTRIATDEPSAA